MHGSWVFVRRGKLKACEGKHKYLSHLSQADRETSADKGAQGTACGPTQACASRRRVRSLPVAKGGGDANFVILVPEGWRQSALSKERAGCRVVI